MQALNLSRVIKNHRMALHQDISREREILLANYRKSNFITNKISIILGKD